MLALVDEHDIQFIRLWFTDILGQLKSFAVGKDELEDALEQGMGFDGSSITGFNRIEESDMIAMPDPSTFAILPWRPQERAVARMFCDVLKPGGEPYEGDPRHVMRRALERATAMGFDDYFIGPELEFFYFRQAELNGGQPEVLDKGGYFDLTTLDAASDLRRDTVLALERLGIPVEYTHHEVGPVPARDRHALRRRHADGRQRHDLSHHRQGDRDAARRLRDLHAQAAVRRERLRHARAPVAVQGRPQRVLRRRTTSTAWAPTAKSFIAGQLKHAREISALFAQWVNSYKRLVPGYEAPVYIAWSRRNRSALIRVPMYHPGKEQATRCELRCPDPSCNPYLTFAAMLQAGLEGIEKGYELPDADGDQPLRPDAEERRELGIEQLPETLGEAIEEMAGSELVRKALGDHVFERYIDLKRAEWEDYRVQVTPWELDRYLSIL